MRVAFMARKTTKRPDLTTSGPAVSSDHQIAERGKSLKVPGSTPIGRLPTKTGALRTGRRSRDVEREHEFVKPRLNQFRDRLAGGAFGNPHATCDPISRRPDQVYPSTRI